jgi:hypothetical protein
MTKHLILVAMATLAFTGISHAQSLSGDVNIAAISNGAFTDSSLTLATSNISLLAHGDLTALPSGSAVLAAGVTLTGLSTTPTQENISNFLSLGTRFQFDLTSLAELANNPGVFSGTGTLVDKSGVFQPTAAAFNLGFSTSTAYSLNLATTATATTAPEPSTWASLLGGLVLLAGVAQWRSARRVS